MIEKLAHRDVNVTRLIHSIFQRSYQVEADVIGVDHLPPLSRSLEDIAKAKTEFYGYFEGEALAAVVEIECNDKLLDINSLTVDPDYFRKGIAGKLLRFVLDMGAFHEVRVETAAQNLPAINLYKKHGFVEYRKWVPDHGIEKVALSLTV